MRSEIPAAEAALPPTEYVAISVRQPWASLIVHGGKDIENRTWATAHRGPLVIHANKNVDRAAMVRFASELRGIELPLMGVIGLVEMRDCIRQHPSQWFVGPVGWVLAAPRPIAFVSCKGRLGLFRVPAEIVTLA